jgi:Lipopolysaccharide kinase (Kdo/WaaP) family
MKIIFSDNYLHYKKIFTRIISNFKNDGVLIGSGKRNVIKHHVVKGENINFKSFKKPNPINSIVYRYFRKSKARRSFEYANLLISKNFNTPQPIAFVEYNNFFCLTSSYYICEHLFDVFTLREVYKNPYFVDREIIIRDYVNLIYQLHENGIEFIDNTSANFLIRKEANEYKFFLVDLNRMNFYTNIKTNKRLKNLSKTTNDLTIIKIIGDEYSRLTSLPVEYCIDRLTIYSAKNQFKRNLKNKLKFYKFLKLNKPDYYKNRSIGSKKLTN